MATTRCPWSRDGLTLYSYVRVQFLSNNFFFRFSFYFLSKKNRQKPGKQQSFPKFWNLTESKIFGTLRITIFNIRNWKIWKCKKKSDKQFWEFAQKVVRKERPSQPQWAKRACVCDHHASNEFEIFEAPLLLPPSGIPCHTRPAACLGCTNTRTPLK